MVRNEVYLTGRGKAIYLVDPHSYSQQNFISKYSYNSDVAKAVAELRLGVTHHESRDPGDSNDSEVAYPTLPYGERDRG